LLLGRTNIESYYLNILSSYPVGSINSAAIEQPRNCAVGKLFEGILRAYQMDDLLPEMAVDHVMQCFGLFGKI